MAYDNIISRSDAAALIPEVVVDRIFQVLPDVSVARKLFVPATMSTNQTRMPVASALPVAYFRNGDTGLAQTSELAWTNKYIDAEEIDCIVPIPNVVLQDSKFDIWGESQPKIAEAVGRTLDGAVFFGAGKPASWPTDIASSCVAASNTVERGTNAAAEGGITGDISAVMGVIEAEGYDASCFVTSRSYKQRLRDARDTLGRMFLDPATNTIYGDPVGFGMRGQWPTGDSAAELFALDQSQFVLAIRKDLTWKFWDQAVIQDNTGRIIFNLAQQQMTAICVTFRAGWQVANAVNYDQPDGSLRYPAGLLTAPGA